MEALNATQRTVLLARESVSVVSAIVCAELAGAAVVTAHRTLGTMLSLCFRRQSDAPIEVPGRSLSSSNEGWELLVEAGRWSLKSDAFFVTDENAELEIDGALNAFVGSIVYNFIVNEAGELKVSLSNDGELSVGPSKMSVRVSEWVLFRGREWSIGLEPSGQIILIITGRPEP